MDQVLDMKGQLSSPTAESSSPFSSTKYKNKIYTITRSSSNMIDNLPIFDEMEKLNDKCIGLSTFLYRKASIYKVMSVLSTIYITIVGAIVGVIGATSTGRQELDYTIAVLAFSITVIKALTSALNIDKRAYIIFRIAQQLSTISRDINLQNGSLTSNEQMIALFNNFAVQFDNCQRDAFGVGMTLAGQDPAD